MTNLLVVAVGGGIGAVSRYLASNWAAARFGSDLPYGTLLVNVVGCFIIGLFMVVATERYIVSPYWRLLVTVGFVGGLTTFSSYSYESWMLLSNNGFVPAGLNLILNICLGFGATWVGIVVGRLL